MVTSSLHGSAEGRSFADPWDFGRARQWTYVSHPFSRLYATGRQCTVTVENYRQEKHIRIRAPISSDGMQTLPSEEPARARSQMFCLAYAVIYLVVVVVNELEELARGASLSKSQTLTDHDVTSYTVPFGPAEYVKLL
jgi:hypothetical protein